MNFTPVTLPGDRLCDYFAIVGCAHDSRFDISNREGVSTRRTEGGKVHPLKNTFQPQLLDRFPLTDHADSPFPTGVANFAFPINVQLKKARASEEPLPLAFKWVGTAANGQTMYGHTLLFWQQCSAMQTADLDMDAPAGAPATDVRLFQPRAFCVLSRWNFAGFRTFLTELFRIVLSGGPLPIERIIANFLTEVPLPPAGRLEVQYSIGAATLSLRRPPPNRRLSPLNLPMRDVFEALDHDTLVTVWMALLTERQILLVSSQFSLLTSVAEVLAALLFPFRWTNTFVPILPVGLAEVLQAPMPYLVGVSYDTYREVVQDLNEGTVVVDLDRNSVHAAPPPGSYGSGPTSGGEMQQPNLPALPSRIRAKLMNALSLHGDVYSRRGSDWIYSRLPSFDSAFSFSMRPDEVDEGGVGAEWDGDGDEAELSDEEEGASAGSGAPGRSGSMFGLKRGRSSTFETDGKSRNRWMSFSSSSFGSKASKTSSGGVELLPPKPLSWSKVRAAFFRVFTALLLRYREFLVFHASSGSAPADHDKSRNGSSSPRSMGSGLDSELQFNKDGFLAGSPSDARPFLSALLQTQLWANFIDDRLAGGAGGDVGAVIDMEFFDESLDAKLNRNKLAGVRGKRPTPFLSSREWIVAKSVVALSPDTTGLPGFPYREYHYLPFPDVLDKGMYPPARSHEVFHDDWQVDDTSPIEGGEAGTGRSAPQPLDWFAGASGHGRAGAGGRPAFALPTLTSMSREALIYSAWFITLAAGLEPAGRVYAAGVGAQAEVSIRAKRRALGVGAPSPDGTSLPASSPSALEPNEQRQKDAAVGAAYAAFTSRAIDQGFAVLTRMKADLSSRAAAAAAHGPSMVQMMGRATGMPMVAGAAAISTAELELAYRCLLDACARAGAFAKAYQLLGEVQASGLAADASLFRALFAAFFHNRLPGAAQSRDGLGRISSHGPATSFLDLSPLAAHGVFLRRSGRFISNEEAERRRKFVREEKKADKCAARQARRAVEQAMRNRSHAKPATSLSMSSFLGGRSSSVTPRLGRGVREGSTASVLSKDTWMGRGGSIPPVPPPTPPAPVPNSLTSLKSAVGVYAGTGSGFKGGSAGIAGAGRRRRHKTGGTASASVEGSLDAQAGREEEDEGRSSPDTGRTLPHPTPHDPSTITSPLTAMPPKPPVSPTSRAAAPSPSPSFASMFSFGSMVMPMGTHTPSLAPTALVRPGMDRPSRPGSVAAREKARHFLDETGAAGGASSLAEGVDSPPSPTSTVVITEVQGADGVGWDDADQGRDGSDPADGKDTHVEDTVEEEELDSPTVVVERMGEDVAEEEDGEDPAAAVIRMRQAREEKEDREEDAAVDAMDIGDDEIEDPEYLASSHDGPSNVGVPGPGSTLCMLPPGLSSSTQAWVAALGYAHPCRHGQYGTREMREVTFPNLDLDTCRETCPDCGHALTLEEVHAGWTGDPQDYSTACPACTVIDDASAATGNARIKQRRFVARFSVTCTAPDWRGSGGQPGPGALLFAEYLHPAVLIKELQSALGHGKFGPQLRERAPVVFWNLLCWFGDMPGGPLPCDLLEKLCAGGVGSHGSGLARPASIRLVSDSGPGSGIGAARPRSTSVMLKLHGVHAVVTATRALGREASTAAVERARRFGLSGGGTGQTTASTGSASISITGSPSQGS